MRFYRYPDLKPRGIPWSRKHLLHLMKIGKFPKAVRIGANTVGWVADEVDRYLEERVCAREAA